jgi:hypothetical protein
VVPTSWSLASNFQKKKSLEMVVTHLLLESLAASWLESYHFNIGMKVLVLLLQFTTK